MLPYLSANAEEQRDATLHSMLDAAVASNSYREPTPCVLLGHFCVRILYSLQIIETIVKIFYC